MDSAGGVSALMRANGWRQGCIVSPPDFAALELDTPAQCTLGVITSQDCDVVASDDVEPNVEIIAAIRREEADPSTLYGKNPRLLSIPVSSGGYLELDVRNRGFLAKKRLCEFRPHSDARLSHTDVRSMARWLGKRYTRDAFPDAFNERLKPAQKKLARVTKSAQAKAVEFVLVSLEHGTQELPPSQPYRILVWFVFRSAPAMEDARRAQAEAFARAFVEALRSCRGIEVLDDSVKALNEVTLEDLETMKRLDYDFRSPEAVSDLVDE